MNNFSENDAISIRYPVEAEVVGENRKVVMKEGSIGTVVLVLSEVQNEGMYEVEFFVGEQNCYALAAVSSNILRAV